jgi:hypothetical protein
MFGLEIISLTGNTEIVERCYLDAKNAIKSVCK